MPADIHVKGGPQYLANIQYLEKGDALKSLESIKTHLELPGRTKGTLLLINRHDAGDTMQLSRKSGFQMWFRGANQVRDTRAAITELFERAGLHDARTALDGYQIGRAHV